MTEEQLTPWFGEDAQPVREGVYQIDDGYFVRYAYWDGKNWGVSDETPDKALDIYKVFGAQSRGLLWRGLLQQPQLDLFDNVGAEQCQQPDLFASA